MKEWTKISHIDTGVEDYVEDGVDYIDEIIFKGGVVEAASFCKKRKFVKFTLSAIQPADESDQEYVRWMEWWMKEMEK